MLWADVSWSERISGLDAFHKLLAIPLLLAQFRRSDRARWVVFGFLGSALVLLVVSWWLALAPGLTWRGDVSPGVPTKDYISQTGIFVLCALGLLAQAAELWRAGRVGLALALALVAAAFLANIVYVATGRTTIVVMVVLVLLLGFRLFGWKGVLAAGLVVGVLAGLAWMSSPYLRERIDQRRRKYPGLSQQRQHAGRLAARILAKVDGFRCRGAGDRPRNRDHQHAVSRQGDR